MTTTIVIILVVLLIGYGVFAVPMMFQFRSYCERVAEATGRNNELYAKIEMDEDGNNAFEREQWRKLVTKDFVGLADPTLLDEAYKLSRKVRISYIYAIGLVFAFALFSAIETNLL